MLADDGCDGDVNIGCSALDVCVGDDGPNFHGVFEIAGELRVYWGEVRACLGEIRTVGAY